MVQQEIRKTWHEIGGFVTTREERITWIGNVRTDSKLSLSDHKPKTMKIATKRSKMENQQSRKEEMGLTGKNWIVRK